MRAGMARLEALGFELLPFSLPEPDSLPYLAASDRARAASLIAAFEAADGVIALRGGYGCTRLLTDDADRWRPETDQALIGFSDLTALHQAALLDGHIGYHGPNLCGLGTLEDDASFEAFARILRGRWQGLCYPAQGPVLHPGHAEGTLVGGCLSVLASMAGSPWLAWPDGAILLLEEVSEAPYRIDRTLTQLKLAGLFEGLAGVAIGDLVRCPEPSLRVLERAFEGLGIPVLAGFPIGHGATNWTIPIGAQVELSCQDRCLRLIQAGAADR